MNHILYLLVSVLLCGLGFIIWIVAAASHVDRWHCSFCGYSDEAKYLTNPLLRKQEQLAQEQQKLAAEERKRLRQKRLAELPRDTLSQNLVFISESFRTPILLATGVGLLILLGIVVSFVDSMNKERYRIPSRYESNSPTTPSRINSSASNVEFETATRVADNAAIAAANAMNRAANLANATNAVPKNLSDRVRSPKTRAEIIVENANLRVAPDSYSAVVEILVEGSTVEIIKQRSAWFYVRYDGSEGWIHGNTIRILSDYSGY